MRLTVNVDCTPEEARAFLGLPDVSQLNAMLVDRMSAQTEANLDALDPAELMKTWMNLGGMMRDQFLTALTAAAASAAGEPSKRDDEA